MFNNTPETRRGFLKDCFEKVTVWDMGVRNIFQTNESGIGQSVCDMFFDPDRGLVRLSCPNTSVNVPKIAGILSEKDNEHFDELMAVLGEGGSVYGYSRVFGYIYEGQKFYITNTTDQKNDVIKIELSQFQNAVAASIGEGIDPSLIKNRRSTVKILLPSEIRAEDNKKEQQYLEYFLGGAASLLGLRFIYGLAKNWAGSDRRYTEKDLELPNEYGPQLENFIKDHPEMNENQATATWLRRLKGVDRWNVALIVAKDVNHIQTVDEIADILDNTPQEEKRR